MDTSFKPTPLAGRRAGERTFRDVQTWNPKTLDEQYDFAWPSAWSRDRENRILPGLWIGGLEAAKAAGDRFDLIVNLSGIAPAPQRYGLDYRAGPPQIAWPIDDGGVLPDLGALWRLANLIANELRSPSKPNVLVHCAAGINRSALLCAAVVMLIRDVNGKTAMRTVRAARRGALCNPTFEKFLTGHGRPTKKHRRAKRGGIYWPSDKVPS